MNAGIEPDVLRPEAHAIECARHYAESLKAGIDAAEQRRFDELQIAVIARCQLLSDPEHFVERRLRDGTAAAHQFEDVGIALLRHDGRARGEGCRKSHEAEFLCIEK